jgi:diguanylate cyclase (GGDEF)-like protein/PAS domain S-box-containing protein
MIRSGRRRGWWLLAIATVVVVACVRALGQLQPLENVFADLRARWFQREVPSDIVIVAMDDASLARLGPLPWPRDVHARMLDFVSSASPRSVFMDVDLSARAGPLDDARLEAAFTRPRDFPIYLPIKVEGAGGHDGSRIITSPRLRFSLRTERAVVHAVPDPDGLVRHWRTSWSIDGKRAPSIIDLGRRLPDDFDVPIDFSISPRSFDLVSYADVLEGRTPRELLADRNVFIGATSPATGHLVPVPLHGALPAVIVQALAAETVTRGVLRTPPVWTSIALLAACAAFAALSFSRRGAARWSRDLVFLLTGFLAIVAASLYFFVARRLTVEVAGPAVVLVLMFLAVSLRALERQTWRAVAYGMGLRRRDALLKNIVQSSTDCIICVDEAGTIQIVNPAASRLFDCPAYELVGQPVSRYITLFAGEGAGARLGALHGMIRECDARTTRGDVFPVEISVSRVRLASSPAGERLFTAIVRDIRERREQQRRLQHQATHDSLTGLPNRAALLSHLDSAVGAGAGRSVVLLMLDLCRFKEVNDTLGHTVGDRVLCEVAHRLAMTLGAGGLIARIGGDEFTVVFDREPRTDAVSQISQALADSLRAPIDVAGISIEVGVSIGIARYPQDASDAQSLLRHADAAMYAAKRRGVTYEYYDAAHDRDTASNLAIGAELRVAMSRDQLELHYQPQVNLRTGLVESCEALLRWQHPSRGLIGPGEFLAIAESTDLIRPLTEWTIMRGLAQVREWRDRGLHLRVAVNLSPRLLQDTAFPARLRSLLEASGASAAALELDVTESALMQDPARALRVLQDIAQSGVLIAIDDFGTGYSSLGYLRDLPVRSLKLDRSFVAGMRDDSGDRLVVESAAQMARALKLELVAEGVESEWNARFLKATGYDYAQGFFYSRALGPDQFMPWALEYNATAMLTAGDTTITAHLSGAEEGFSGLVASRR